MTVLSILLTGLLGIFIYPTVIFGWHAPDLGWLAWIYLIPLFIALISAADSLNSPNTSGTISDCQDNRHIIFIRSSDGFIIITRAQTDSHQTG